MTQQLSDDAHKQLQDKLQELVEIAFSRGLLEAIEEARSSNNPYLLDAFHDILTDKLHEELVKRRVITELK